MLKAVEVAVEVVPKAVEELKVVKVWWRFVPKVVDVALAGFVQGGRGCAECA